MVNLFMLGAAGGVGVLLTVAVTMAPLASRPASVAALVLAPFLGLAAWQLTGFIAPLGTSTTARDPVEAFDLWLAGTATLFVLAALACLVRLAMAWRLRQRT